MGIYDRDYIRPSYRRSNAGALAMWSISTWLIVINIAVFALNVFAGGILFNLGAFTIYHALLRLQLWRFITFQFLHGSTTHIFFNMLALYFFGPLVETYL